MLKCTVPYQGGTMSEPASRFNEDYVFTQTKFISLATTFLAEAHKVALSEKRPEIKVHLEAIVAELEVFLADLDEGFDKDWKERSKQLSASLEELDVDAEQLQAQGHEFEALIDESWPIKDDLRAFLSELTIARRIIRVQLGKDL
jgi:hypothetical protein